MRAPLAPILVPLLLFAAACHDDDRAATTATSASNDPSPHAPRTNTAPTDTAPTDTAPTDTAPTDTAPTASASLRDVLAPAPTLPAEALARVRAPLDAAARVELVSLLPLFPPEDMPDRRDALHDWPILGAATLTEREAAAIRDAVYAAIAAPSPATTNCFEPRHALRLHQGTADDAPIVDLLLCFACGSAQMFVDGEQTASFPLTSQDAHTLLDRTLRHHHIPLSTPALEAREQARHDRWEARHPTLD